MSCLTWLLRTEIQVLCKIRTCSYPLSRLSKCISDFHVYSAVMLAIGTALHLCLLTHLRYRNHRPTDMLYGLLSLVTRLTIWFNDFSWLGREAPCRLIKHTSVCTCETLLETVIGEIKIYPKCERHHALVWDSNRIKKSKDKVN